MKTTGSVQEKNGRFYFVLNLYDANGKRKIKWISTGLTVRGNKRKAEAMLHEVLLRYLLDSGLVPCHDSGKKTRRYTIQTRDVVTFLCDREDNPDKYKAPKGLYIGNSGKAKRRRSTTEIIRFHFTEPEKTGLYKEWERLAANYDDLLTTSDVTELTGYSAQSIQRWCNQKILVGFQIRGKLLVPRLSIIEFMAGNRATAIARKSPKHLELLRIYAQECHEGAMTITY